MYWPPPLPSDEPSSSALESPSVLVRPTWQRSTEASRRNGVRDTISSRWASVSDDVMPVSTRPGATTFEVMPRGAYSRPLAGRILQGQSTTNTKGHSSNPSNEAKPRAEGNALPGFHCSSIQATLAQLIHANSRLILTLNAEQQDWPLSTLET